jgi:signal peptidase II
MTQHIRYALHGLVFCVLIVFDQLTKYWALSNVAHVTLNRGVSWGMFHSTQTGYFAGVSLVVTVVTLMLAYDVVRRLRNHERAWPLLLVVVGSTSNIIDRVVHGGVVDFIQLAWRGLAWPTFNGADMLIVCGVLMTVFDELRRP